MTHVHARVNTMGSTNTPWLWQWPSLVDNDLIGWPARFCGVEPQLFMLTTLMSQPQNLMTHLRQSILEDRLTETQWGYLSGLPIEREA